MAKSTIRPPRRRPRLGDILEVKTAKGLGYLQWTHRFENQFYRDLVRAIEGLFETRPRDLDSLAARPTLFWTYVFLGSEWSRGTLTSIGPAVVPAEARQRPAMRVNQAWGHAPPPRNWLIVDSQGDYHPISEYPAGFWQLSQQQVMTGFVDEIEHQVRPEDRPLREIADRLARDGDS